MGSEFSPGGGNAKMTKGQIKKYLRDIKKAQELTNAKMKEAEASGEFAAEAKELKDIEKELDNL